MSAINTDFLNQYQINTPDKKNTDPNQLMQDDFLTLMTTQLKQQDPFKPTDNGEFLGQMAQFSTVSGLEDLQKSFDKLASSLQANQTLTAASLIGRDALTESNTASITESERTVSGSVAIDTTTSNATVNVFDATGAVVDTIFLGAQTPGQTDFKWDGKLADDSDAPPGSYTFETYVANANGATEAAYTQIYSRIESVSLNSGAVKVNTADGKSYDFASITQIH